MLRRGRREVKFAGAASVRRLLVRYLDVLEVGLDRCGECASVEHPARQRGRLLQRGMDAGCWRVDHLAHPRVPLLIALDARDDALVYVSLGADVAGLYRHAWRHGARVEVERRKGTPARRQLGEYLDARRRRFELTVRPLGTPFQRRAWASLLEIPYGRTISYAEQAAAVATAAGARAVGQANGSNPVPIVVPCHRVVGSSGKLTGFGGGLETKRWLLELEATRRVPSWVPALEPSVRAVPSAQLTLF
jgi:methylated-DNA-[protein]-cysteine S-methyltransferase